MGNSIVLFAKAIAFLLTAGLGGASSAMLAEIGHSIGDVSSQAFLLLGIHRGKKKPDDKFALGYGKERYFWSLMAAVIVAFLGGAMLVHGIETLIDGHAPKLTPLAIGIFAIAAIIESITLIVAFKGIWKDKGKNSFRQYMKETTDPSGIAVLLEDFVAVVGVAIALGGIALTKLTGIPVFDAIASMAIGTLMFVMAAILMNTNRMFLIGRTHEDTKQDVAEIFRTNPKIERTHDIRAMVYGVNEVVVHADIELREERFLEDINGGTKTRFSQIPRTNEELVKAVVTRVSAFIDELEGQIRLKCPEVTKISIEVEQFKSPADQIAES
jgi:zinc transporter 9